MDNKRFWNRCSKYYPGFIRHSKKTYRQIHKAIRPFLTRDMDVLELACGTGELSISLSPYVRNWEATDFSPEMVKQAKKQLHTSRLHFSIQDATKLPYCPESFDAVVISNALHIIPQPEKALSEAWRVLKPGGFLFAPTFVWGKGPWARFRLWVMGLSGFRVYHPWNAGELMAYLSEHGYTIVCHQLLGSKFTPLCCLIAQKPPLDRL
ncbi:SAM-dependent methyltransferase [Flavonifractor sp. An135]|nr:class I SAM-dependent methyltransferase [Flavonifractor sp. An135]OUQ26964.1 SAM-dependent methyltransferase [Flavonifractor sp. An135]